MMQNLNVPCLHLVSMCFILDWVFHIDSSYEFDVQL